MTKEIIVNAGEMESRVAILEDGRLMELHIEREPKIVGNIYRGRVTKVLKGMDAAFVDIGIERNAFLSASDVVHEDADDEGNGRRNRVIPPITQLLHANQEVLVQVARAPMGTKGARVTTRLSLPGRYMVLMLNSGSYIGVSRKIDDMRERHRLRALANSMRPDDYSLIVRTEAEGKSDEELRQDMTFLLDMARRIEGKAVNAPAPSLVHGDLTLIFRLIRDAFTRDINRLVVDSPGTYENILELVGMIAPRLKSRVFLYDAPTPIFHAYNIEPEIERMLRRKVWLPSGGHLAVDQAEALTAIDVNTGRFVGSVELSDTVLTTNLQAADEVARQLRLRDLGGIIVVDFIDMDNPKHRQQVMKVFEDALRRDRAKIKVHSISPLGLVEMTRKRTGESLADLLTEPCPYCSGIGRVQNPLTMALRIERDLAATAEEHREAEAFLVTAHPRVVANMLGFEGEAQRDLELYLQRPIYVRAEREYHANAYHVERLTLEQAMHAVQHVEDGEIVEGQVMNPDPDVSLSPLVMARGIYLVVPNLDAPVGAHVKVRVTEAGTSLAMAEPLSHEQAIRGDGRRAMLVSPPILAPALLPAYLREEQAARPPRSLPLQSPTAAAGLLCVDEVEVPDVVVEMPQTEDDRRKRGRRRKREKIRMPETVLAEPMASAEPAVIEVVAVVVSPGDETAAANGKKRRRRRRRSKTGPLEVAVGSAVTPEIEEHVVLPVEETEAPATPSELPVNEAAPAEEPVPAKSARTRRGRRRKATVAAENVEEVPREVPLPPSETRVEDISPEAAAMAMLTMLDAIADTPPAEREVQPETLTEPSAPKKRTRARRTAKPTAQPEAPAEGIEVTNTGEALVIETSAPAPDAEAATVAPEEETAPAPPKRRRRATTGTTRRPRRTATEQAEDTVVPLETPESSEQSGSAE